MVAVVVVVVVVVVVAVFVAVGLCRIRQLIDEFVRTVH